MGKIKDLFNNDFVLESINLVKDTEKELNSKKIKFKYPEVYTCDEDTFFKQDPFVLQIKEDMMITDKCFECHKLIQSTKQDRSYNGVDTWFINEESVSTVTISARTLIKSNLLQLCSVLAEIEQMPKYITRFHSMKKISEITPFRWMMAVRINMPFLIDNREVVGAGFVILMEDTNSIILPFKSIGNQTKYMNTEVPSEERSFKRIDLKFGYMHIKPVDEKLCEVSVTFNVDPKVPFIPFMILNKFMKEASYYIMLEFRNQIEKLDKETFLKKISEKKDFYMKVFSRLKVLQKYNPKLFEMVNNF
jgi:hypothetical protein